jgi:hypothetical protein
MSAALRDPRRVQRRPAIGLLLLLAALAGCTAGAPAGPAHAPASDALPPIADPTVASAAAATAPAAATKPLRPSVVVATLQGPQLTPNETAQFVAGLLATPIEHRVRMADTVWRCGLADYLLPPHLWSYVQRLSGRDMDDGFRTEMGLGFHLSYTHFAEPVLFHFVQELEHGTSYHKLEVDFFLQYLTLQFEDVSLERFRDRAWVQKRANRWLAWVAKNERLGRMRWAMEALERRPVLHPERVFQVLEELTALKPFSARVDPEDAAEVDRRCAHWLAWWADNRDWVYWFEDETGPVLEPFPRWWSSSAGKGEREKGLYRVDVAAKAAGVPSAEFRRAYPWR